MPNAAPLTAIRLLFIFGSVACFSFDRSDPANDVAVLAGNTDPMRLASGVELGMRARTLKRVRPGVQPAPYAGYSEQVGEYRIGYSIPGSWDETQVVPDGNRITAVTVSLASISDSVVNAAWNQATRQLASTILDKPRCVTFAGNQVTGEAMLWRTKSVDVIALVTKLDNRSPGPADSTRFSVLVGDSPFSNLKKASRLCPEQGVWRIAGGH